MKLEVFLKEKSEKASVSKPLILDLQETKDQATLEILIKEHNIQRVVDDFEEQLKEYFQVTNPSIVYAKGFEEKFSAYLDELQEKSPLWQQGRWAYFPWLSTIVHLLEDKEFQLARTARNRNLITKEEQEKFYNAVIGIGGLSIGNSVALAIALQGGGQYIRLADFDTVSLSNLNRIRGGIEYLGLQKVEMTARQIYELNPYAIVDIFSEGLTKENINKFFEGPPKLDIVIDELDNIAIKYLLREQAKKHRTPLLMGADNGDNAVVDIERYDLDPQPKFFHGRIGETSYEDLAKLDKFGIGKTITKHIGPENVTQRMRQSLVEMGKTIVSWPQLGGTALLNGSAIAYCARKILNNEPLASNRAIISFDELFIPEYNSPEEKQKRAKISEEFKKVFGL